MFALAYGDKIMIVYKLFYKEKFKLLIMLTNQTHKKIIFNLRLYQY